MNSGIIFYNIHETNICKLKCEDKIRSEIYFQIQKKCNSLAINITFF
jgi:hypothetical protein